MLAEFVGIEKSVDYRHGAALNLPLQNESFDHAWTQHVAMNIADRARFYREIHRVLKPGGRLGIHDAVSGNGLPIIYPVLWSRSSANSFLVSAEAVELYLTDNGFHKVSWCDVTELGVAWFEKQRQSRVLKTHLGLQIVMGEGFPEMSANFERNLKEGRVRLVRTIMERRFRSD